MSMTNINIQDKVNSMKNIGVTKNLAERIEATLSTFSETLNNLLISTTDYKQKYEKYKRNTFIDSNILKTVMKEKVIQVMNDDI